MDIVERQEEREKTERMNITILHAQRNVQRHHTKMTPRTEMITDDNVIYPDITYTYTSINIELYPDIHCKYTRTINKYTQI